MNRTTIGLAALACTLLSASGCVSLTPPERPAWQGTDQVGDVPPESLVGVWRVRELNPYPDAEPQDVTIEYRDDGTVSGRIVPRGPSANAFGDIAFQMNGQWKVDAGIVSHSDVEMETIGDNAFARMMSGVVNGLERDLGGSADIQELGADRIVMLGTDGGAMEYLRQ